jgi:hypothetical protein
MLQANSSVGELHRSHLLLAMRGKLKAVAGRRWTASVITGVLYVAMMPAAALLYTTLGPGSFYDSNLAREPSHLADAQHVDAMLTGAIEMGAAHGPDLSMTLGTPKGPKTVRLALLPGNFRVTDIVFSGGNPTFDVSGELVSVGQEVIQETFTIKVEALAPAALLSTTLGPRTRQFVVVHVISGGGGFADAIFETLFSKKGLGSFARGYANLEISQTVATALRRFFRASIGDPLSQTRQFVRMLYFSATAATTVGFGDITAVTETARVWVTVEVVIEVVLIGIFLASLVGVREKSRSRHPYA